MKPGLLLSTGSRRVAAVVGAVAFIVTAALAGCSGPEQGTAVTAPTPEAPRQGAVQGGAVPGVSSQRVLFGQSAAFSGPASELGTNMKQGILAAFDEANRRGGVHGRLLELVSLDDAYEPEAAIANTIRLIDEEEVFALIGAVGTPTSRSATPITAESGIPYVAPFTGAAFLRDPNLPNVINLRASYNQETEEMVARLTGELGLERIAVMFQDDSFGRAGYRGTVEALERRGMEPVAVGLYPRNTTAVKTALLDLRRGRPEAVVLVGAYEPVAALIAWARHTGLDPVFMTVSFVGSNALAKKLGPAGAGVYVTQVVPYPWGDSLPVVGQYRRALSALDPAAVPGFVSFEGYLAGRLALASLDGCGPNVDHACFVDGLDRVGEIDLGGFKLRYGEGDNQGSDSVFLTVIGHDGLYHPIMSLNEAVP